MPIDAIQIVIGYLKGDRSKSILEVVAAVGQVISWVAGSLKPVFSSPNGVPVAFEAPSPATGDLHAAEALQAVADGAAPAPIWLLPVLSLLLRRLLGV